MTSVRWRIILHSSSRMTSVRATNFFQSVILFLIFPWGVLVRLTKGARNQAQEIIQNLHVLQNAKRHCMDPAMNPEFASFLACNFIHPKTVRHSAGTRLLLKNRCVNDDASVRLLFPSARLDFFKVLYLNDCRLCTSSYSHGKTTDDSNILFPLNGNERFGRIRAIFTINGGHPMLFVAHLGGGLPLVCALEQSHVEFPGIRIASSTEWSYTLTDIDAFLEKTVYWEDLHGNSSFYRFPNLIHSS